MLEPAQNQEVLKFQNNLDICRNLERTKMKFCFLIIFKNSYLDLSLFYWLVISLQYLS